jgi:hypothetical protein
LIAYKFDITPSDGQVSVIFPKQEKTLELNSLQELQIDLIKEKGIYIRKIGSTTDFEMHPIRYVKHSSY